MRSKFDGKTKTICSQNEDRETVIETIPDIIKGKKAFQLNEFDQYLKELQKRVKK